MEPYKIFDFPDETAWLKGRMNGIGGVMPVLLSA